MSKSVSLLSLFSGLPSFSKGEATFGSLLGKQKEEMKQQVFSFRGLQITHTEALEDKLKDAILLTDAGFLTDFQMCVELVSSPLDSVSADAIERLVVQSVKEKRLVLLRGIGC